MKSLDRNALVIAVCGCVASSAFVTFAPHVDAETCSRVVLGYLTLLGILARRDGAQGAASAVAVFASGELAATILGGA